MGGWSSKVGIHDSNLNPISSDNPLPTTSQLSVEKILSTTGVDLNAAAYSTVITPSYDYIIDNISFSFSSSTAKTINVLSDNGAAIYSSTVTGQSVILSSVNYGQSNGESFTITVSSTAVACTMSLDVNIKNSPVALTSDPILAPGSRTSLQDSNEADITSSNPLTVLWPDSARNDAFQRIRISEPETIFDSKQIFDNQPLIFDDQEVSGTGTSSVWSKDRASSVMSVSSSTAGKRVRQTFMRFNYQPGKSQLILLTGRIGDSGQAGITRSMGYFDDSNGVFVRDNEGTIEVVIRSGVTGSTVEDAVAQSSWNLDKLDGTGSSGYTLDPTKAQIFVIDFEWLGVGRVRTGFVIDGKIVYCHEFNHSNVIESVYMSTPNLPIRYEIENDGTGGAATLEHICATVMSEGGTQNTGVLRHYNGPRLINLSADTKYVFMAGRLKSTHLGATINIENVSVIATGNTDNAKWELIAGGTLSAGTLSFNGFTNSAVEIADGDKTQTHNGDGIVIDGGYFTSDLPSTASIPNALKLGSSIDGTPQVFYVTITPITNNITIETSITWRELS